MRTNRWLLAVVMMMVWCVAAAQASDDITLIDTPAKAQAAQLAWAQKLGRPVQWTNSVGMVFQLIPPGEFIMGSPQGDADAPPHRVRITQPYYIGTYEVTRAQWEAVTRKKRSNYFDGDDKPINFTTWHDSAEFLRGLNKLENDAGYRLPTEAQWEYACRAGAQTAYATGDDQDALAQAGWYVANAGETTHVGGGKSANAFGVHDMHGNVWEWCNDFYSADYYTVSPLEDPAGPAHSLYRYRVVRGGSIHHGPAAGRSFNRAFFQESRSTPSIGFRVVLPIRIQEPVQE